MVDRLLPRLTGRRPRRDDLPPRAHLIGMAGAGMQALGEVLLDHRWRLSGSDRDATALRDKVSTAVQVHLGHDQRHVCSECDLVIHSTAVPADNVERRRAAQLAIPSLSYPKALARIVNCGRGLAVAGTHGKSTTVAMTDEILRTAGIDPTVIAGGVPMGSTCGGRAGRDELTLVEACEYRRHFLGLRPSVAVILGIELDHFDCYRSLGELQHAFAEFAGRVKDDGLLIARHDCRATRSAVAGARCRLESFGLEADADWRASELFHTAGRWTFQLRRRGRSLGRVRLSVPGRHNVLSALAAAALGHSCGACDGDIVTALERFPGLQRRLQTVGLFQGVTWIDDYAHHPTEVTASLETVRQLHPRRRVWCVFQPHQTSRTRHLLDEFAHSLQNADKIMVADVFRARERLPRSGDVSAADLAAAVRRRGGCVVDGHSMDTITAQLGASVTPGDVVITMGAGDIRKVRDELVGRFRAVRAAG